MAGIQFLGNVGSTGTSTGPHKHVYVKDLSTNTYLNPSTSRTPLLGLRVGKNRIPALQRTKEGKIEFNPQAGITLTSSYGPRTAPTAGASTFHRGEDWALPEGTPIYYEGGGTFTPKTNQGGYGNLATFITPDKKYEVGLGHMQSLGQQSTLPGAATTSANLNSTNADDAASDLLSQFLYQAMMTENKPSVQDQARLQMLNEFARPNTKGLGQQLLESYMSSPLPGAV